MAASLTRENLELNDDCPSLHPGVLWAARGLAALGMALAAYLALMAWWQEPVAGCGSQGAVNCDEVLASRWSSVLGLPVALPAGSLYASLLAALCFVGPRAPGTIRLAALGVALVLAAAAAAAATWFIFLQAVVVGHWCTWCLGVHACSLLIAGLLFAGLELPAGRKGMAAAIGGLLTVLLALVQIVVPPVRFEVVATGPEVAEAALTLGRSLPAAPEPEASPPASQPPPKQKPLRNAPDQNMPDEPSGEPNGENIPNGESAGPISPLPKATSAPEVSPVAQPAAEQKSPVPEPASPQPLPQRAIKVLSGKVQFNLYEQPFLGNPAAPKVVVKLFDYTCVHCRRMHGFLEQARQRYGEQLVVVLLPVPLSDKCNTYLRGTGPQHAQACELARFALAVQRTRPEAFAPFNTFLMAGAQAPSADVARAKAVELIGGEPLARQLDSWDLDQQLRQNVELYGDGRFCGGGQLPKLLFPAAVERGTMETAAELFALLEKELLLVAPDR